MVSAVVSAEETDSVTDSEAVSVEVGAPEVVVESEPHSPTKSGTALGPVPMATRLVPQSSLLASQTFLLSQSYTT